ncbi:MAG: nitroreductase [Gemmatimonadota bacterium]|nr:nitroreductase [Gemmatimonadota bacterium]
MSTEASAIRSSPDRLFEALRERRSFKLKHLDPSPIDLALVERMLEAANWAPSHGDTEPWRFVVFHGDGRGVIGRAMGEAYRAIRGEEEYTDEGRAAVEGKVWRAPVWIALGVEPDPGRPEWEELVAFGCAVHNAQLMASAHGLASKWTSGSTATHPAVARAVGFGPEISLRGFLYVGRPAVPWPEGERRPLDEKIRWSDGTTAP